MPGKDLRPGALEPSPAAEYAGIAGGCLLLEA